MKKLNSPKPSKAQKEEMQKAFDAAYRSCAKGKHPSKALMEKVALKAMGRMRQQIVRGMVDGFEQRSVDFRKQVQAHFKLVMEEAKKGKNISVLPPGTRYFIRQPQEHLYVIEHQPQVRMVFAQQERGLSGKAMSKQYRIAMPYVVFLIIIRKGWDHYYAPRRAKKRMVKGPKLKGDGFGGYGCYCSFRNAPLRSLDDVVCNPPIPNREEPELNRMCLGKANTPYAMDPFGAVSHVIERFYCTQFTGHPTDWDGERVIKSKKVRDFANWEKNTQKNPLFILKIKWQEHKSLAKWIDDCIGYGYFEEDFYEEEELNWEFDQDLEGLTEDLFTLLKDGRRD